MTLYSLITTQRIPLILPSQLHVANPKDPNEYRGRFVEECVKNHLRHCGAQLHTDFPCEAGAVQFTQNSFDIHATAEKGEITYDALAEFEQNPFAIEIKSGSLNGYESKIPVVLDYATRYFGRETPLLLFFSRKSHLKQDAQRIQRKFGNLVQCIDLGYTRRQLAKAIQTHKEQIK